MRLGPAEVPRWLLIAVVVLVILAGGSCSVGVLRGDDGGDEIPGFLTELSPDPPPVPPGELTTDCSLAGSQLTIVDDCTATIEPSGDVRRRLRLTLVTGVVDLRVKDPRVSPPPTATLRAGNRVVDVVVERGEGLEIDLDCRPASCQVDLD